MKTLTVLIGNSDNKLTQEQWSFYVNDVRDLVRRHAQEIHFIGGSPFDAIWQNAAFVLVAPTVMAENLVRSLQPLLRKYGQQSIAVVVGETKFIRHDTFSS